MKRGRLIRGHARRETRTLLDVGCGGGKNVWTLKRAFDVTGIDVVFVENEYDPDPADGVYDALMVYLIRQDGRLRVETGLHRLGLFPLSVWRATLREAGFEVREDRDPDRNGGLTFVRVAPEADPPTPDEGLAG